MIGARARLTGRAAALGRRLPISPQAGGVVLAVLVFLGITIWWLTQDNRVPDFDEGAHLLDAFAVHTELMRGQLTAPFTDFNNYPPLVHIVGALGIFVGGLHEASVILADNFVFVPLLAGGCYGVGSIAYGRRAGLLAAVFALGTPMVMSEMREYYVDPGEAAMVAASAWAVLASRRFERVGISALAGLVCALGMLSKQTYPLFIGGLVAMVILRGGWRNWRGLLAFLAVGGAFALPWYIYHYGELASLTSGATANAPASGNASANAGITPSRYTPRNFAWYLWNMINHQYLAPMTLLFGAGTVASIWRFARHRDRNDLTPELLAGGLVGYLGVTYINLKDPRYSLPAIVYVAVFSTGWIATMPRRARPWLAGALGAFVLANTLAVSFGVGSTLSVTLPGAPSPSIDEARVITFYSPTGWLRGPPVKDGDVLGLFESLARWSAQHPKHALPVVEFDGSSADVPDFTQIGLTVLAEEAGLPVQNENAAGLTTGDAFVQRHFPAFGDPPPCQTMLDGSGIYVELGNPLSGPFSQLTYLCPTHHPQIYRTNPHVFDIKGAPRRELLAVMRAMRRQGVTSVQFDPSGEGPVFFQETGLVRLAAASGLYVPPVYTQTGLGPHSAYFLRHTPVAGDAAPCERFPDGTGLYIVLGNPAIPWNSYRFYCPLRTPRFYRRPGG